MSREMEVEHENKMDCESDRCLEVRVQEGAEDENASKKKAYLPHYSLKKGETLVADQSAYIMLHTLTTEWPCLSIDVFPYLGSAFKEYPLEIYLAAGTQAPKSEQNHLYLLKCSNLTKTYKDNDDESDDDEIENTDPDPRLTTIKIPIEGSVNKVRVLCKEETNLVAAWSDTGKVLLYNVTPSLQYLAGDNPNQGHHTPCTTVPLSAHIDLNGIEGYALSWSHITPPHTGARLAVGNIEGKIIISSVTPSTSTPSIITCIPSAHSLQVDDIRWSPTQENVFMSASSDKTIKVWDIRANTNQHQLSITAHDSDVNTISWNHNKEELVASGADDGSIKIWDLRTWSQCTGKHNSGVSSPVSCAFEFTWHKKPVTCVEWRPDDASTFVASGSDNQISIWDLLAYKEEEATDNDKLQQNEELIIPPQLMFIHQGQEDIKEVVWHPRLRGLLASIALEGINVFETINSGE